MTRYRYFAATSLDGFLADDHDSLEWLLSQPTGEGESILPYERFITEIGAIVTGRTTFDWVLENAAEADGAWAHTQPTFVFTHRELPQQGDVGRTDGGVSDGAGESGDDGTGERAGIAALAGPPAQHRARIEGAAGGKDVWIVGGGDLAAEFARDGMLDEVFVSIAPVTLGAGRPLLGRRVDLALREHGTNGALLEARYEVADRRGAEAPDAADAPDVADASGDVRRRTR